MKIITVLCLYLASLFQFFYFGQSGTSVNPTWLPNNYFQTKPALIKTGITTTIGSSNPITKTIPFVKLFTAVPQLGFGIKNYRGNDLLYTQNFAITRTGLTTTGFTVFTQINGYTNIRILTLIYMAVDRSFPYHLNIFSDIPANHSNGLLKNISGTQTGVRTYVNNINYTTFAATISSPHNKFGAVLTKNSVALYLNAIYNKGSATKLVKFTVTTQVLTIDKFSITVVCQDGYQVDLLRFTVVAMDVAQFQATGLFTISFEYKTLSATVNQYVSIPKQFAPATFIGLLDYSAKNADCGLEFNWQLDLPNNRVIINASVPYSASSAKCGILQYRIVIFYVKTWSCPSPNYYFNLGTNLCDDFCAKYNYQNATAKECQLCNFGCYQCVSGPATGCTSCNAADNRELINNECVCKSGYYPDPAGVSSVCLTCTNQMANCATCQLGALNAFSCLTCAVGYAWTGTTCVSCVIANCQAATYAAGACTCSACNAGYGKNGVGCALCSTTLGAYCQTCTTTSICTKCDATAYFYLNGANQCATCSLTGCTTCASLTTCSACDPGLGYFLNPTTHLCQTCSLTQCSTCLSFSQCSICNTAADYFLNPTSLLCQACSLTGCTDCQSAAVCDVCDGAFDYFLNPTTFVCQKCTLLGCTDCNDMTQCTVCDETNDYFLDAGTGTCVKCPVPGCLDCLTISTCSVCDDANDYFLNGATQCQKCSLTQCTDCISLVECGTCSFLHNYYLDSTGVCLQCDTTNGFFANSATNLCQPCAQIGCTICTSFTTCTACDNGINYFLDAANSQCYLCDAALNLFVNLGGNCEACSIPGCTTCSSLTVCTACDNAAGYFIQPLDDLCYTCPLAQCTTCATIDTCSVCNTAADFFLNPTTFVCQACALAQCLDCSSPTQCVTCNTAGNFFLNPLDVCQACSLTGCSTCSSLAACQICDNAANYFLNSGSNLCEPCTLLGCSTCSSLATCSVCDTANLYFLDSSSNNCYLCDPVLDLFVNTGGACEACSIDQCLDCDSLTDCGTCDQSNGYFIDVNDNLCYPCLISGCLSCATLTTCLNCDTSNSLNLAPDGSCKFCPDSCSCDGYVLPQLTDPDSGMLYCSALCGDGLTRVYQQCDDGNLNNGDGCSSECTVQQGWTCDTSNPFYSCCSIDSSGISMTVGEILKVPGQNSITFQIEIIPTFFPLTPDVMKNNVIFIITGLSLFNERRNFLGGQRTQLTYDYSQSIQGKKGNIKLSIQFSQTGAAPNCTITAEKEMQISALSNNNLPFMFYSQDDLKKREQASDLVKNGEIITYSLFFASMIPCKIIGLELIGVMQLAYFTLAQQQNVNLLLEPFMKMNSLNGFNTELISENNQLPSKIESIGIKALFLNNCNVMFFLILAEVAITGILYGLSHLIGSFSQKLASISKFLIKQGLLTLMMFNAFNIAFGAGVHFQYADKQNPDYALSSLAALTATALIFCSCGLLMFAQAKQFGQFKDKLKPNLMCQLYFVFSLIYRYCLGYYIAVKAEYSLSSLVVIGFSLIFICYNLTNLPFTSAYHNYRANICHISQLVILFVTNYYQSMTENDPLEQKAYTFSGAHLQIGVIYASIVVSGVCLIVQIYKFIQQKVCSSKSSLNKSPNQKLPTNSTQNDISLPNQNQQYFFNLDD